MSKSALEDTLVWQLKVAKVPTPEREVPFKGIAGNRRWRWDLYFPAENLAVECEGGLFVNGGHNRGKQIQSDCMKLSEAVALGIAVMRVTAEMIESGHALLLIERALKVRAPVESHL